MVVVDRFSGEVRAMVGGAEPRYAGYNRAVQARRSIGRWRNRRPYLTALSQPNLCRLNTVADAPISLPAEWSGLVAAERRSSLQRKRESDAGGCVNSLNERTDGRSGDGVGFTGGNRCTDEARRAEKISSIRFRLYAVRSAEPDMRSKWRSVPDIASGGNRAPLSRCVRLLRGRW